MAANTRSSSGPASPGCAPRGCCRTTTTRSRSSNATTFPPDPANRSAVPQGRHVHLLMARGAAGVRERSSPACSTTWSPPACRCCENRPGLHPLRRRRARAGHRRRRCATSSPPTCRAGRTWSGRSGGAPATPERRDRARRRHRAAVRRRDAAGDRRAARRRRRRSSWRPTSSSTPPAAAPGCRSWLEQWGFERPPEDTVDVGIGYATHQVRIPDGLIDEKVVVAGASREQPRGLGMLCLRGRHLGPDDVRRRQRSSRRTTFAEMCALADEVVPAAHRRRHPPGRAASATWRSTSTRPAGGAATTSWSASPRASCRSATRWSASTRRTARA